VERFNFIQTFLLFACFEFDSKLLRGKMAADSVQVRELYFIY